jgi:hypothetical protein
MHQNIAHFSAIYGQVQIWDLGDLCPIIIVKITFSLHNDRLEKA